MKSRCYTEGLLGFLSLLGFVGIFTEHRAFLAFFAFAVDFRYFFLASDEMLKEYMNKSAARAFYWDMLVTGCVAAVCMLRGLPAGEALLYGILSGWAAAVAVQALSVAYYQLKESWGLGHDPE